MNRWAVYDMSYEQDAKYLDEFLTSEREKQKAYAIEISELLIRWDSELEPIKAVIRKHGLSFFNPGTNGKSEHGVVIGGTSDEPLVLIRGSVYRSSRGIEPSNRFAILSDYIRTADLKTIKSGLDFVRNFSLDNNSITSRNKELEEFLKANKGEMGRNMR
jgi:hypothetical protein